MNTDNQQQFIDLKGFEDKYEICTEYPYIIRIKSNHYELKERFDKDGYILVNLNGIPQRKHRLIANQFIVNDDPEHKKDVDHMNKIRDDNHISNLRWVTKSENNKNKTAYNGIECEYVDEIDEEAIIVDQYGDNLLEDYYYFDDVFYFWNGIS